MVPGDLPGHPEQKQHLPALAEAASGRVCYRTAWRVKHKLWEAMAERESRRPLTGVVLADDAYLGGVHDGKPGRGSENKAPFLAALELNDEGHPQHVRRDPIPNLKGPRWRAGRARHCTKRFT